MNSLTAKNPLLLELPQWIDTNYKYDIVWNELTEAWEVLPF